MLTEPPTRVTDKGQRRVLPFGIPGDDASKHAASLPRTQLKSPSPAVGHEHSVSPELLSELHAVALPLGIVLAALAAKLVYLDLFTYSHLPVSVYLGSGLLAGLLFYLITQHSSLNSACHFVTGRSQMRNIVLALSLSFLMVLGLVNLLKISHYFSRLWLCLWFVMSLAILSLERFGFLLWARLLRAEKRLQTRVAIYGTAELTERVAAALDTHAQDYLIIGRYVDESVRLSSETSATPAGMAELIAEVRNGGCDRVIIALPRHEQDRIRHTVDCLDIARQSG